MKSVEEEPQALLHLFVRIQHRLVHWAVDEADRERRLQFAPSGFVQNAALQTGFDDVQLSLAHRAF